MQTGRPDPPIQPAMPPKPKWKPGELVLRVVVAPGGAKDYAEDDEDGDRETRARGSLFGLGCY